MQNLTVVTNLRDKNGNLVETTVRKNVTLDVVINAIQELWQTPYEAQLTIRKFNPRKTASIRELPEEAQL
ncbi:MAG TPA: hypothetical protein VJX72_14735 [Candidatus Acidoferrum sp.]|nr:hypothetical protein [Candidatus Acidoferrum sp.]